MKSIDLKDKVSVIVGAAGDIGSGIARCLAESGSSLAIVDRDFKRGKKLAIKLGNYFKLKVNFYKCDITKRSEIKETIKIISSDLKYLDNLIYTAGYSSFSEFVDITDKEWDRSMDINLNGAFYFIQEIIKPMLEKNKGNIIMIGSTTTINGSGGGSHYAVSKIGLLGLMKSMTYELLDRGIRVNIVSPGVIDTKMLRVRYPDTPEVNRKIIDGIPLGRMGKPEDIGNIVSFLCSDLAEYICGQEIIADGGRIIYRRSK